MHNWLENVATSDVLVIIDGTNNDFISIVIALFTSRSIYLIICTSFERPIPDFEVNENYYSEIKFTMSSWTYEEYKSAQGADVLNMTLNEMNERYFYAGGCIRLLFWEINKTIKYLNCNLTRVAASGDFSELFSGRIGYSSKADVNNLTSVHTLFDETITSVVMKSIRPREGARLSFIDQARRSRHLTPPGTTG